MIVDTNVKIFIFQVFTTVCLDKATDLILDGECINLLWPCIKGIMMALLTYVNIGSSH